MSLRYIRSRVLTLSVDKVLDAVLILLSRMQLDFTNLYSL
jgi:hypothetical protein